MMTLAAMVGIDVPPIQLVDVSSVANLPEGIEKLGPKAFVMERFDRLPDGKLVHIEDFAQVFGVYAEDKYERANKEKNNLPMARKVTDAIDAHLPRVPIAST